MRWQRALVSAYACEPGKGSEPGVGWNWVRLAARLVDEVWVVTRTNNKQAIEAALASEPMPNVHWIYYDLPKWARFWKRGRRGVHLYYYLWQIVAYRIARKLHRDKSFDLVHHVTFGNYWLPGLVSLLPAPFVWGPLGGGESAPKAFYKTFSWRGKVYEALRSAARWLGEKDPFTRTTARRSAVALAKAKETATRLSDLGASEVRLVSEVVFPAEEIARLAKLPIRREGPFRLVSVGNLLHLKGFHLGIRAFSELVREIPSCEYWIVGNGPERAALQRMAEDLGVADKIRFWGRLPRDEVLEKLSECDVLVHPSLHDSGGWAIVEAMAAGRPVICLDLGGPALQVTDGAGYKIQARTPEQAGAHMVEAMKKLAKDSELRIKMAATARRRVEDAFSWDRKLAEIAEVYRRATQAVGDEASD